MKFLLWQKYADIPRGGDGGGGGGGDPRGDESGFRDPETSPVSDREAVYSGNDESIGRDQAEIDAANAQARAEEQALQDRAAAETDAENRAAAEEAVKAEAARQAEMERAINESLSLQVNNQQNAAAVQKSQDDAANNQAGKIQAMLNEQNAPVLNSLRIAEEKASYEPTTPSIPDTPSIPSTPTASVNDILQANRNEQLAEDANNAYASRAGVKTGIGSIDTGTPNLPGPLSGFETQPAQIPVANNDTQNWSIPGVHMGGPGEPAIVFGSAPSMSDLFAKMVTTPDVPAALTGFAPTPKVADKVPDQTPFSKILDALVSPASATELPVPETTDTSTLDIPFPQPRPSWLDTVKGQPMTDPFTKNEIAKSIGTSPVTTSDVSPTISDDVYKQLISLPGWGSEDPSEIVKFNQGASDLLGYSTGPQNLQTELATGQRTPPVMVPVKNADGTITMQPSLANQIIDPLIEPFMPKFIGVNDSSYTNNAAQKDDLNPPTKPDNGGDHNVVIPPPIGDGSTGDNSTVVDNTQSPTDPYVGPLYKLRHYITNPNVHNYGFGGEHIYFSATGGPVSPLNSIRK